MKPNRFIDTGVFSSNASSSPKSWNTIVPSALRSIFVRSTIDVRKRLSSIEHTPRDTWEYDTEKHWRVCTGCEEKIFSEGEHRFDNCSSTCSECNAPLREESERHVFNKWEHDAKEHWRSCLCKEKSERNEHVDENGDDSCDVCGRILIKSAYADMEFLQGFISFLDKFGILRQFEPLKQKLDTALVSAGFAASAAATLSVTIIIAGFLLIIFIILAILWLWLKAKIRRRRKMREEEED